MSHKHRAKTRATPKVGSGAAQKASVVTAMTAQAPMPRPAVHAEMRSQAVHAPVHRKAPPPNHK